MSSASGMPKVTDSFFRALIWRSVRPIFICFIVISFYSDQGPMSTPKMTQLGVNLVARQSMRRNLGGTTAEPRPLFVFEDETFVRAQ